MKVGAAGSCQPGYQWSVRSLSPKFYPTTRRLLIRLIRYHPWLSIYLPRKRKDTIQQKPMSYRLGFVNLLLRVVKVDWKQRRFSKISKRHSPVTHSLIHSSIIFFSRPWSDGVFPFSGAWPSHKKAAWILGCPGQHRTTVSSLTPDQARDKPNANLGGPEVHDAALKSHRTHVTSSHPLTQRCPSQATHFRG